MGTNTERPRIAPRRRRVKTGSRVRQTVQLSGQLVGAIEEKADAEALPSAALLRRAVTKYARDFDPEAAPVDVDSFAEHERRGSRGPLRQWPQGVSYVLDEEIAARLRDLAKERSEHLGMKVKVADLAREAIVVDLTGPAVPQRPLAKDEFGFTTSNRANRGGDTQAAMDEAWRATNE